MATSLTSFGFIVTALVICLTGSSLLTEAIERASRARSTTSWLWRLLIAAIAGVTVWTTHFIAMLGFRPDLQLSYNLQLTLLSMLIGVVAVGFPLALLDRCASKRGKAILGFCAGTCVGAMHVTGMAAIEGCSATQTTWLEVLAYGVAGLCFGAAQLVPDGVGARAIRTGLYSSGVAAAHFISLSGFHLQVEQYHRPEFSKIELGGLAAACATLLLIGAFLSLVAARRFRRQEHMHSEILATALENMLNGLVFVRSDGRINLINRRFSELFNLRETDLEKEMLASKLLELVATANGWTELEKERIRRNMRSRIKDPKNATSEFRTQNGRIIEIVSGPFRNGLVMTFEDVTAAREAQSHIAYMAYHDPLTGLSNRRSLEQEMERDYKAKHRYKLLLVDLDRFKNVNDTFGHKLGDLLLQEVSRRLSSAARAEDFVARFGGDEFAVLVRGDLDTAMTVARRIIDKVSSSYSLAGEPLSIGCSVGMCCTDDASSVEELMQRADIALYTAKKAGRGQASCYQTGMLEDAVKRHALQLDLDNAIQNNEFHLVFQPVLSLCDDRIIGYEALIRWTHPSRGDISPVDFIPLAEETGQIVAIGQWVIDEACRQASSWQDNLHVAINVSAVQFRSSLLGAQIVSALARSGLPAWRLEIELTETALVEDGKLIAHTLNELRMLGIKVAMDDFGTGYSSLAHLRDFPLDRIKIDKSFVDRSTTDRHSMAVLKAVIQLGRDLDVKTLAEGVETGQQLELLRNLGCDAVQGYLIGKPAVTILTSSLESNAA